jgi:hypothetical protein
VPVVLDKNGNVAAEGDPDLAVVEAMERLAASPDWEVYTSQLRGNWEFEQKLLENAHIQRAGDTEFRRPLSDDHLRGVIFGLKLAYSLPAATRRRYNEKKEQERLEAEMDQEGNQGQASPGAPFRDSPIPDSVEEGEGKWA